ncbi:hypothetical protein, partial [Geobacillus sp. WSUCF1]|uniref:hypothetical protein n=1 Tax=Geobacillus sp. WSUCF1 TaxID=886559 RepID=UPI001F47E331
SNCFTSTVLPQPFANLQQRCQAVRMGASKICLKEKKLSIYNNKSMPYLLLFYFQFTIMRVER